jgi:hypothetical protein
VRVRFQDHRQRGAKSLPSGSGPRVYALRAAEIECIGKGKARAPYEFGCKVSVATPGTRPKGGQFVLHAKALHGNPFAGRTLGPVIAGLGQLTIIALGYWFTHYSADRNIPVTHVLRSGHFLPTRVKPNLFAASNARKLGLLRR